jgi:hypothetical protein
MQGGVLPGVADHPVLRLMARRSKRHHGRCEPAQVNRQFRSHPPDSEGAHQQDQHNPDRLQKRIGLTTSLARTECSAHFEPRPRVLIPDRRITRFHSYGVNPFEASESDGWTTKHVQLRAAAVSKLCGCESSQGSRTIDGPRRTTSCALRRPFVAQRTLEITARRPSVQGVASLSLTARPIRKPGLLAYSNGCWSSGPDNDRFCARIVPSVVRSANCCTVVAVCKCAQSGERPDICYSLVGARG